jgi:hypothetical protein
MRTTPLTPFGLILAASLVSAVASALAGCTHPPTGPASAGVGGSISGVVPSSGNGASGGGSGSGCPDDYPIDCNGTLCCPVQFPVCGGGCGANCCPADQGGAGGSGGSTGTGSGAGGSQCVDLTSCVGVTLTQPAPGSDETDALVTNDCGQTAFCRVCPVKQGSLDCLIGLAGWIQAGQTQGVAQGWWWYDVQSVQYRCAADTFPLHEDPEPCVAF